MLQLNFPSSIRYRSTSARACASEQARPSDAEKHACATVQPDFSESVAASLGIYAKNSSRHKNPSNTDLETGEILGEKTIQQARWERWALKSVVNKILPSSRTSKCMRWRVPDRDIQLLRGQNSGRAFYHGLQVCSSVWACPVCAAKITERRRSELVSAVSTAKDMGLQVLLVTLTVPHGLGDDVRIILDKMQKAVRKLSSDKSGVLFRKSIGLVGTIKALEVTYGKNGFHPHLHFLYFVPSHVSALDVDFGLTPLWQNACVKSGLPRPSDFRGCSVQDGSHAAAYCSKWGIESEMTKGHTKISKSQNGRSMWDLLRAVLADKTDKQSAALFRVYAEAFKGRRQLHWSVGLRKLLASVEKTDEELANELAEDPSTVLAEFTDEQWRLIYRTRSESVLLDLAESSPGNISDFLLFLGRFDRGKAFSVSSLNSP